MWQLRECELSQLGLLLLRVVTLTHSLTHYIPNHEQEIMITIQMTNLSNGYVRTVYLSAVFHFYFVALHLLLLLMLIHVYVTQFKAHYCLVPASSLSLAYTSLSQVMLADKK